VAALVAAAAALLATPVLAAGASVSHQQQTPNKKKPAPTTTLVDPNAQLQVNGQRRAGLDQEIDALRSTDAQIQAQLASITGKLEVQKAELARAEAAAAAADAAFAEAETAAVAARAEADRTKAAVKDMAIQAYLHPPGEAMATVLVSHSIEEASQRQSMLSLRAERQSDVLDQRRAALEVLEEKEGSARSAKEAASTAKQSQASAVKQLEVARQQQAGFASAVDRRLESALGEAVGLDALDAKIAKQVQQQQEDLRRQAELAGIMPPPPTPPPTTAPPPKSGGTPTTKPPLPPLPQIPSVDVVDVGGFTVSTAIAPQIGALLIAFSSTGLTLGGGGYRSPAGQIATRQANCGPTYYDIYEKPASACSPPTARPGTSMHELGMAIDFTCNGTLINSHSDPCFIWLETYAATYGLYNLPSEPWHWSTNGH
jgi:hypothetical protein